MRDAIRDLIRRGERPDHAGLAYDVWAPVDDSGRVEKNDRDTWLGGFADIHVPQDYRVALARWRGSFEASASLELVTTTRLLIGHGNPAPTDVGLTLHRTWGVPVIPRRSSLKGLTAAYVDVVYGPDDGEQGRRPGPPSAGVRWDEKKTRMARGPGEAYRRLFRGARIPTTTARRSAVRSSSMTPCWMPPDGDGARLPRSRGTSSRRTTRPITRGKDRPLPNDYEDPIPVAFLTVKPGARFLAASSPGRMIS